MKLIHTWTYRSATDEVLGYVKRWEVEENGEWKKQVVPYFKRDGDKFLKGGAQKPRPLFNIPGIINAKTIVVVEGEKCAAALMQLGIPATCNCGGAGAVRDADWTPCKNAEKFYLLPDADLPGETYIDQAARAILEVNSTAKFSVLRVPSVDGGEDIIDWLQAKHLALTAEEWNGYESFGETTTHQLLREIKAFFKEAQPYYPDLHTEAEEHTTRKTSSQHTLDLRNALTFPLVLSHFGKSTAATDRTNGYSRCSSPFSNDSNPSFDFNEERKVWHCFSSGRGGDIFNLIAELLGCSAKGEDWKKIIDTAETITGIARPKQEKRSNVTSILTKLPVDLTSISQQLHIISPENLTPNDALVACDGILRAVAGSDGVQDEFVIDQIKSYFKLTGNFIKPFRAKLRAYRQELITTGATDATRSGNDDRAEEAPKSLYMQLYPKIIGEIRKDIFSGDCMCWDEQEEVFTPVANKIGLIRSRFRDYGEKNNVRFSMQAVEDHFDEFAETLQPEICVKIPEWDGKDRLKELAQRVELVETQIPGLGTIDIEVLEDFIKEWHARMWQKLQDPHVQNRIIVLKGPQGIGKDFWLREQLGGLGQFAVPMTVEDSNKDTRAQLHQGLAVVISEFDRTSKHHTSTLKDMLTAPSTMIRLPYDRRPKFRYVRCSFVATCNVDDILRDHTGNRRYILFPLKNIAKEQRHTPADWLQVLAQGLALAAQNYTASERSERLMQAYIKQETPDSPLELLLEEWDDAAAALYDALPPQKQMNCRGLPVEKTEFTGFLPNKYADEQGLMAKLGKQFGWNENYIRILLKRAGRAARYRVDGAPERGFFWKTATCVGDLYDPGCSGSQQNSSDLDDVDFI